MISKLYWAWLSGCWLEHRRRRILWCRSTYVGATVNLERRLRQHNKEIKGGAIATTSKVNQGYSWRHVCYVKGFPSWQTALLLSFIMDWKGTPMKKNPYIYGLEHKKQVDTYKNTSFKFIHVYAHTKKKDIHSIGNQHADKLAYELEIHRRDPHHCWRCFCRDLRWTWRLLKLKTWRV